MDGNAASGIAGAAFGIDYNGAVGAGVDVYSWTMCADAQYSSGPAGVNWPAPGSGNLLVWDRTQHCQNTIASGDLDNGVTAVLGSFYVYAYSADLFLITQRTYVPVPDLSVGICNGDELPLLFPNAVGKVGFGVTTGVDPCQ